MLRADFGDLHLQGMFLLGKRGQLGHDGGKVLLGLVYLGLEFRAAGFYLAALRLDHGELCGLALVERFLGGLVLFPGGVDLVLGELLATGRACAGVGREGLGKCLGVNLCPFVAQLGHPVLVVLDNGLVPADFIFEPAFFLR